MVHLGYIEGDIEFPVAVGAIDGERREGAEVWDGLSELVDRTAIAFPLDIVFVWCEAVGDELPVSFG